MKVSVLPRSENPRVTILHYLEYLQEIGGCYQNSLNRELTTESERSERTDNYFFIRLPRRT